MRCRPMFLLDAGEPSALVPLKMLIAVSYYSNSLIAYVPIFFDEAGYSKSEIGVLLAIPCLCSLLAPPLWGALADAYHCHKKVHVLCHITAYVCLFAIHFVRSFPLMCALVFAAYCQLWTTFSLLDLAALKLTARFGGDFGKQRLYGAMGYGIGGYICGLLSSYAGTKWCFTMALAVASISLAMLVHYIPVGYGDEKDEELGEDLDRPKPSLSESLSYLTHRPDVLVLFLLALLMGVSGGFIDSFLFLNVYDLSSSGATIVSVFVAVETLSEIPIFFVAASVIARVGSAACIVSVVAAFFVRHTVYAYMQQPWYVVPVEALHGVTFGLLTSALTTYLYAAVPKEAGGTTIGLLAAAQRGIGSGIAALAGGYVYDHYGPRTIWKAGAFGLAPISFGLVGVFAWLARKHGHGHLKAGLDERLVESATPSAASKRMSLQ